MPTEAIRKKLEKRAIETSAHKSAHASKINADIAKLKEDIRKAQGVFDAYEESLGRRLDDIDHPDASIRSIYKAAKKKKAEIDTMNQALLINQEALGIFMQRFRSSITAPPPDEMPLDKLKN